MLTEHIRPNPDELLARIQANDARRTQGKLKIFLGYAAGVGKTYAMLEAAHQRRIEGVDVVVGYVETHGRAETEALVTGLEVVPRKQLPYRDTHLSEMDLDAVCARGPQLVLVDELAHTNTAESRHPKRYLDVEELLAAGIDVYTTMNIQHLESLNDVVAQITGVTVREKVPDSVLDEASEIEVVDLPPPELLQRLQEGKVYVPEQAARAIQRFFRMGNLTALREMALRRAAERVDEQMRAYMETRAIPGPWPAAERLLVCVSSSPLSERLVRAARHLADELSAEWFALYVETPGDAGLSQDTRDRVARVLQLAEGLGARSLSMPGVDVSQTVVEYARRHNITKIIAGRPVRRGPRWLCQLRGSVVDSLIQQSGDIDVYVISAEDEMARTTATERWRLHRSWQRYLGSLGLVAAATLLCVPVHGIVSPANLVMIYLAVVVIAAIYLGRGPAALAAGLSVLTFDFFFVQPRLSFSVADTEYVLTFAGLFVVGLVISTLAARSREQANAARQRETQTVALYELSRDLAGAGGIEDLLQVVVRHIGETLGREAAILLPAGDTLQPRAVSPGLVLSESELAVAAWAFRQVQPAGRGTDTLHAATMRYVPLVTARGPVGVLGVKPHDPGSHLTPEQRRMLDVFASQAALAIERAQLADQARQTQLSQATEELQRALLNSISHDLRTPLVSITGTLTSLDEEDALLDDETRRSLIAVAREEAERLNRLVGNLLEMTRIEAGALRPAHEPCDVQEVVRTSLDRLGFRLDGRLITVDVPAILVPMDFLLMVQVMANLLDNALKYSQPGTPIGVEAHVSTRSGEVSGAQARENGQTGVLELAVTDRGQGIPPEDTERIFDKFYRVHRPESVGGTGLGLAICKAIVEAHGGRIQARNRPGGGTMISITLPLDHPENAARSAAP
jgi:two-component system, OmpR family, sensor histidine kinase KdpD